MTSVMIGERSDSAVCFVGSAPSAGVCTAPRCEIKIERCKDGCKIFCSCDDDVACGTLQNVCKALAGGLCSVCCTWNGVTLCQCNFACCRCQCEPTRDGVCISCTCGDAECCRMVQALCDCVCACQDGGCVCTVCFNGTPVCCSTC